MGFSTSWVVSWYFCCSNLMKKLTQRSCFERLIKVDCFQSFDANRSQNWKDKDSAIFLFSAVAAKGQTSRVSGLRYFFQVILFVVVAFCDIFVLMFL